MKDLEKENLRRGRAIFDMTLDELILREAAHQAKAALDMATKKTDANDTGGLAHLAKGRGGPLHLGLLTKRRAGSASNESSQDELVPAAEEIVRVDREPG